jgi:lipoprotein signal peptidase
MNNDIVNIIAIIIATLLLVLLIQICWNSSVSKIFNVKDITIFQAFVLLILSKLLFGGICVCDTSLLEKNK